MDLGLHGRRTLITGGSRGIGFAVAEALAAEGAALGLVARDAAGLAAAAGQELASAGIRVNAVSPGSIMFPGGGWDTFRRENPEDFAAFLAGQFPFGRLGTLPEVADVVAFLLSERTSWITGANIVVDGGQNYPSARRFS